MSKVHSVWYSYRGLWVDEPESEPDSDKPSKPIVKDRKVKVDIYVHKTTDDSAEEPPYSIKEIWFEMRCEEVRKDDRVLAISGADIEVVRSAMWGELDKKFEVQWHRYLLVQISDRRPYGHSDGLSVDLTWEDVWKGIAHDGTLLLRTMERWGNYNYSVKPWPGDFRDNEGKALALIPDTEANVASLEEFRARFKAVAEAMKTMLRPEVIEETFLKLNLTKLLPLPTE